MKYINSIVYKETSNELYVVFLDTPAGDGERLLNSHTLPYKLLRGLHVKNWYYTFICIPIDKEQQFVSIMEQLIAIADIKYLNYGQACNPLCNLYYRKNSN